MLLNCGGSGGSGGSKARAAISTPGTNPSYSPATDTSASVWEGARTNAQANPAHFPVAQQRRGNYGFPAGTTSLRLARSSYRAQRRWSSLAVIPPMAPALPAGRWPEGEEILFYFSSVSSLYPPFVAEGWVERETQKENNVCWLEEKVKTWIAFGILQELSFPVPQIILIASIEAFLILETLNSILA